MADTKRKLSDLLTNIPVGTEDGTSAQDLRDVVVSAVGSRRVDTITSDTTVDTDYDVVLVDATTSNVTVTLPAASGAMHKIYTVKRLDGSGNTVSVTTPGTETIDGGRPYNLTAQYQFITIACDGSNWYIIAKT